MNNIIQQWGLCGYGTHPLHSHHIAFLKLKDGVVMIWEGCFMKGLSRFGATRYKLAQIHKILVLLLMVFIALQLSRKSKIWCFCTIIYNSRINYAFKNISGRILGQKSEEKTLFKKRRSKIGDFQFQKLLLIKCTMHIWVGFHIPLECPLSKELALLKTPNQLFISCLRMAPGHLHLSKQKNRGLVIHQKSKYPPISTG